MQDRYKKKPNVFGIVSNVIFVLLLIFFITVLIVLQCVTIYWVDGTSMVNTLENGDMVISKSINKIERGSIVIAAGGERLNPETNSMEHYNIIKRVVAGPMDEIVFKSYGDPEHPNKTDLVELYIKTEDGFKPEKELAYDEQWYLLTSEEGYLDIDMLKDGFDQTMFLNKTFVLYYGDMDDITDDQEAVIKLKEDEYFLLGDNRNRSQDSRHYGIFKGDKIIGRVASVMQKGSGAYKFFDFLFSLFRIKKV